MKITHFNVCNYLHGLNSSVNMW